MSGLNYPKSIELEWAKGTTEFWIGPKARQSLEMGGAGVAGLGMEGYLQVFINGTWTAAQAKAVLKAARTFKGGSSDPYQFAEDAVADCLPVHIKTLCISILSHMVYGETLGDDDD